jgi:hypothetical protein
MSTSSRASSRSERSGRAAPWTTRPGPCRCRRRKDRSSSGRGARAGSPPQGRSDRSRAVRSVRPVSSSVWPTSSPSSSTPSCWSPCCWPSHPAKHHRGHAAPCGRARSTCRVTCGTTSPPRRSAPPPSGPTRSNSPTSTATGASTSCSPTAATTTRAGTPVPSRVFRNVGDRQAVAGDHHAGVRRRAVPGARGQGARRRRRRARRRVRRHDVPDAEPPVLAASATDASSMRPRRICRQMRC